MSIPGTGFYSLQDAPLDLFYTGLTRNATFASRTAINQDIFVGAVVCADPDNWDSAGVANVARPAAGVYNGQQVTIPQTAILFTRKYVITKVPKDSKRGGWVQGVLRAGRIPVATNSSLTMGDRIMVQDSSFFTIKSTVFPAGTANSMAGFQSLMQNCGMALHTKDTSGGSPTAATNWTWCEFNGHTF